MLTILRLSTCVALLISFGTANAECQFKKTAELAISFQDEHTPSVSVTIDGRRGHLAFSNRSNAVSLYKDSIESLSLKTYSTEYFINNNGKKSPLLGVHIENFQVGTLNPVAIDLFIMDLPHKDPDLLGVFSLSWFPGVAVEFDYPNGKVNLYDERYCDKLSLAHWAPKAQSVEVHNGDLSAFSGKINGKEITFEINSSQGISTINQNAITYAHVTVKDGSKGTALNGDEGSDPGTSYPAKIATIERLNIAGEDLNNIDIRVLPAKETKPIPGYSLGLSINNSHEQDTPRIILGADYLQTHRVLISPIQRLAYITPTGATAFKTESSDSSSKAP